MPVLRYAELHCWSNFTFLEGASHPEELVDRAVALGLTALALTDRDGLYGAVRFAKHAKAAKLPAICGAELTLHEGDREGGRSPRLVLLAAALIATFAKAGSHFVAAHAGERARIIA